MPTRLTVVSISLTAIKNIPNLGKMNEAVTLFVYKLHCIIMSFAG